MKRLLAFALALCFAPVSFADLTLEQKVDDFKGMVAQYNRNYSNYQWKIKAFGFDALNIQPWLSKIYSTTDDLSFYDTAIRYVASLQDSHDEFILTASYEAWLPITADLYDGAILIDGIDTSVLDPASYPIEIGDELLSVDGTSAKDWMTALAPYAVNGRGSQVSTNRLAIGTMLDRYQGFYTYAEKVRPGSSAVVRIRSQATGKVGSYTMPWTTIGVPLTHEGPIDSAGGRTAPWLQHPFKEPWRFQNNAWRAAAGVAPIRRSAHAGKIGLHYSQRSRVDMSYVKPAHLASGGISPFGFLVPAFNPPPGFKLRLGAGPADNFVSGSFPVGNKTVGFIRIPTFEPADEDAALAQFEDEVAWFQGHTAGLVVDVMDNGGGDLCYSMTLAQLLATKPFWGANAEPRPSEQWVADFGDLLADAQLEGAPQSDLNAIVSIIQRLQAALNRGDRLLSAPVPLCALSLTVPPATDSSGRSVSYTKPLLLLTDNFTLSAAESFSAMLQDSGRALSYGTRTDGGGANVVEYDDIAPYSEGSIRVSQSIAIRSRTVSAPGLPPAPYIENIGIVPDVPADFQTRSNLFTGGQPFVTGFVAQIRSMIGAH